MVLLFEYKVCVMFGYNDEVPDEAAASWRFGPTTLDELDSRESTVQELMASRPLARGWAGRRFPASRRRRTEAIVMFAGSTTLSRLQPLKGGYTRHGQQDQSPIGTAVVDHGRGRSGDRTQAGRRALPHQGDRHSLFYSARMEQMPRSTFERLLTSQSDHRVRGRQTECPALPTMKSSARCARWSVPLLLFPLHMAPVILATIRASLGP